VRSMFGRSIVTEERRRVATAYSNLGDAWHQVSRSAVRIFAHIARRMRANRVEVAQQGNAPVRLGFLQIGEDLFHHQLAFAVSALWCAGREAFDVWDFGLIAINGGGGANNKDFDVSGAHGANQAQ